MRWHLSQDMALIVHRACHRARAARAVPIDPLPRELDRARMEAERQMKRIGKSAKLRDVPHNMIVERGEVWDVLSGILIASTSICW